MKQKFIILFLVVVPILSFAQKKKTRPKVNTMQISIDSIGEVKSGLPLQFSENDTINIIAKLSNNKFSGQIRDTLLSKVQRAINNIQDDSLYLHSLYHYLWPSDSDKIVKELYDFKFFLENDYTIPNGAAYEYIPNLYDLKKQVFDSSSIPSPFSYTPKKDNDNLKIDVIYTDPFQRWFTNWYNDLIKKSSLYNQEMDYNYKKGWRQLEQWFQKDKYYLSKLDSLNKTFYDCTEDNGSLETNINSLLAEIDIDNNDIVRLLKNSKELKQWVWLTDGFVQINPFTATSISRKYPLTEHTSFPDTSIKASFSNEAEFKIMQTDMRIANSLIIPYSKSDDNQPYLIQYDAANNYSIINKSELKMSAASKRLQYKDAYIVCINNLYNNKEISFNQSNKDLKNEGIVIQQLNKFGDSLTSFTKLIPGAIGTGALTILNNLFSSSPSLFSNFTVPATKVIPIYNAKDADAAMYNAELNVQNSFDILNQKDTSIKKDLLDVIKGSGIIFQVNDREITSAKNSNVDKFAILHASLLQKDTKKCDLCKTNIDSNIVDNFLKRDACYEFDYADDRISLLQNSVNALRSRFQCFIDNDKKCRKKLSEMKQKLAQKLEILALLVKINKRSLPPKLLEEFTNESPLFKTVIHKINIPEDDKIVNYEIIENSTKTPGSSDSIKRSVATNLFKVAKYFYFDFSLGIAFTAKDYFLKAQTADSIPTVSQADRFRLLAGIHIYPFGLDKLDNRFAGRFPKPFSFFFGMSIPKGFDNLYAGLSYDFVPGIRTIAGYHFYKDTRFTILNNQVVDKASGYRGSGVFFSLNLEPVTILKYLLLIK